MTLLNLQETLNSNRGAVIGLADHGGDFRGFYA